MDHQVFKSPMPLLKNNSPNSTAWLSKYGPKKFYRSNFFWFYFKKIFFRHLLGNYTVRFFAKTCHTTVKENSQNNGTLPLMAKQLLQKAENKLD